jgi:hypothetical protein
MLEKSPRWNWVTQILTVAYDGACFLNVSFRMAWISNDTIDSVLRHRELGRAKDLSASLYSSWQPPCYYRCLEPKWPIALAPPSKEGVCGRSLAGMADSNPAWVLNVCLFLWLLWVVRWRSLRGADPSSRGVLLIVSVCHCDLAQQ